MTATPNSYLENEVLSATPQKLRLMLIDGAIRFARQAIAEWEAKRLDAAAQSLTRARAIVAELLAAVRRDRGECEQIVDHYRHETALSAQERSRRIDALQQIGRATAGIYLFLFRELTEAGLHQNREKVMAAIGVLEVERETARLVCQQLPRAPELDLPAGPQEITSSQAALISAQQRSPGADSASGEEGSGPPNFSADA